jgi:hypothetical protein
MNTIDPKQTGDNLIDDENGVGMGKFQVSRDVLRTEALSSCSFILIFGNLLGI